MRGNNLYRLGLDDVDRLESQLGGGIPHGTIVLLEGSYGAGKSAMAQRFSYGFCETGSAVTLVSTELPVRGFLQQMASLGYDVEDHLLDEQLLYLYADVESGSGLTTDESGKRKQLLNRLMGADAIWAADVVLIDTFDTLLRNDPQFVSLVRQNDERQAALEVISFFRDVVSDGRSVVLTFDPSTLDDEALAPFRAIADVYLKLEMIEVGREIRRHIDVKRFAGKGERVGERVGYSVRDGTGIVIESRSVA